MDEINEQTENMKQIQEALSAPIGAAADFDEVCIFLSTFSCMCFKIGVCCLETLPTPSNLRNHSLVRKNKSFAIYTLLFTSQIVLILSTKYNLI